MSLLAIDIGTSRAKGVAFNPSGEILAHCEQSFAPRFSAPAFAELNAEVFWEALCEICRRISDRLPEDPVETLCLSSHGETFIPVGRSGDFLGPAILNMDGRAAVESEWCAKTFGAARLFEITGLVAHPMYPLPKLLWLKKHRPEQFASARFLAVTSCLLLRMKLPPFVDYSLASRFLAFDVLRHCWSAEILSAAGLEVDQLPIPVPTGSTAGKLAPSVAAEIGLSPGVLVVVGGHDQACAALGVGSMEDGRVSDSAGTYECVAAVSGKPHLHAAALSANLNSYCHVVPGLYLNLAYFPAGIMVQWFHDLLYRNSQLNSGADSSPQSELARYQCLEAHAPEGPSGLCVTPHLIGTCHPDFNPYARGMIWGLDPSTSRSQIHKAILEGLAFELAAVTDALQEITGPFSDVYATGGGTRSSLGMKLRAALTGKRFHVLRSPEAVCLGGAILAAVAAGIHRSIPEAVRVMVQERTVFEPDPAEAARYQKQRRQYQALCAAGRSLSLLSPSPLEEPAR